jgi:hypothetical protein
MSLLGETDKSPRHLFSSIHGRREAGNACLRHVFDSPDCVHNLYL